ncbi:hypothetical protein QQF64_028583 [Cirrhinus molitorella]|uniref:Uncharacterized protein n=1 Tax=Cirrhinus molitorella TaxID=172907 RepID=A0ABR3N7F2_9TELE
MSSRDMHLKIALVFIYILVHLHWSCTVDIPVCDPPEDCKNQDVTTRTRLSRNLQKFGPMSDTSRKRGQSTTNFQQQGAGTRLPGGMKSTCRPQSSCPHHPAERALTLGTTEHSLPVSRLEGG